MVLGMLLPSSPAAQQELAADAAALQQLMELLKQQEDMDCKASRLSLLHMHAQRASACASVAAERGVRGLQCCVGVLLLQIIAKDLLGLLMKDEALRGQVEAAVRAAAANQQQPQEHEQQAAA